MMFCTNDKPTVYFDVDSTLVFTESEAPARAGDEYWVVIRDRDFLVHTKHVEAIKDFKARGHNVIVWSQGGAAWAQLVVDMIGLTSYVDACLSKPYWYFDDKPSSEWMTETARSYLELT